MLLMKQAKCSYSCCLEGVGMDLKDVLKLLYNYVDIYINVLHKKCHSENGWEIGKWTNWAFKKLDIL